MSDSYQDAPDRPNAGEIWKYEDIANQNTNPVKVLGIIESTIGAPGNPYRFTLAEFEIQDTVTGEVRTSDMRQAGWSRI